MTFIVDHLLRYLGGASSNIYTAVLSGDVDLSVIMTFLSTITSFGTFPFWIWLLGSNYIEFQKTKFPWSSMFLSFITLFIPALTGLLLRRYRLAFAYRIGRFLHPITIGKKNDLDSISQNPDLLYFRLSRFYSHIWRYEKQNEIFPRNNSSLFF